MNESTKATNQRSAHLTLSLSSILSVLVSALTRGFFAFALVLDQTAGAATALSDTVKPAITQITPPEHDFFSKQISFHGIPIKAHAVVSDEALRAAHDRLFLLLQHMPQNLSNLVKAKVELHIIGKDQVTTDLPEWRHDKGKPIPEYKGLTRDERTRGMGGRLVSCGEENLLKLEKDRYRGRDICLHEFAHAVRNYGMTPEIRARFNAQHKSSLERQLWKQSYAGSNADEFLAELTMWYFGNHGDMGMTGPKPASGPEGLRKYDPEAFALFEEFYSGKLELTSTKAKQGAVTAPSSPTP